MSKRVVIVVDPRLPVGILANTVAAIGIGIGAADPELGDLRLADAMGRSVTISAKRPVPILQAPADVIGPLLIRSLPAPEGAIAVPFPEFARNLHEFEDYANQFPFRDLELEQLSGLGLAGPAKWVNSLTGNLKLLR